MGEGPTERKRGLLVRTQRENEIKKLNKGIQQQRVDKQESCVSELVLICTVFKWLFCSQPQLVEKHSQTSDGRRD